MAEDWNPLLTSITVHNRYKALLGTFKAAVARGAEKPSTPFYEWAAGKLLLDAEDTAFVLDSIMDEDVSHLLRMVSTALQEAGEQRLIPALTLDKDMHLILIVVLKP